MAPDPVTASLLAKHSAGEKLSQQEYGKVGAFAARLKRFFGGKDSAPAGSPESGPAPGDAPPGPAVAAGEAADAGLDREPIDAGLVQRTTSAVLSRCENIARNYVSSHAGKAVEKLPPDLAAKTLARFDRAAAIPRDDKALMIEVSPDVANALGLNPRHYPIAVFVGCFGLWATDLWMVVQELKALNAAATPATPAATPQPAATVSQIVMVPSGPRPPNAPPEVYARGGK